MPDIHCGKQTKLSKTMGSPLDTMVEIISSRCLILSLLNKLLFSLFFIDDKYEQDTYIQH